MSPCRCHNYSCGRCVPAQSCAVCASDRGPFTREPSCATDHNTFFDPDDDEKTRHLLDCTAWARFA